MTKRIESYDYKPEKTWQDQLLESLNEPTVIFGQNMSVHTARMVSGHTHDFWQLDYVSKGSGTIGIASTEQPVRQGDLFVLNPGDLHEFTSSKDQPIERIMLKFSLGKKWLNVRIPNYLGNLTRLPRGQQRELEFYLRRACIEANKPDKANIQIASALLKGFLISSMRYLKEVDVVAGECGQHGSSQRVLDYIRKHYDKRLTLSELANMCGLHPQYFCHRFSVEIGMSPMVALSNERIEAAKKLLANTYLPIAEVAARVGYNDAYHFSKRFKQITGLSPKHYRDQSDHNI
ncbi:MAG: AraC family transcriptional regulator [Armatimonadota bacterium]